MHIKMEIETDNPAARDALIDIIDHGIDSLGSDTETGEFHDVVAFFTGEPACPSMWWARTAAEISKATEVIDLTDRLADHVVASAYA